MSSYSSRKFGCTIWIILFLAFITLVYYIFMLIAPKTHQMAKEEVIERVFNVSITHDLQNIEKDTMKTVVIPAMDNKIDVRDTSIIVLPIEVTMNSAYVTIKVNGVDMKFMIDTGCSDMQITSAEFFYMKHLGLANEDDIIDEQTFEYADGRTEDCPVINIKSIVIGGIEVKNINASIQQNSNTSLLLGQNVLKKLGEVSIDYKNKQLKIKRL